MGLRNLLEIGFFWQKKKDIFQKSSKRDSAQVTSKTAQKKWPKKYKHEKRDACRALKTHAEITISMIIDVIIKNKE